MEHLALMNALIQIIEKKIKYRTIIVTLYFRP